jgi:CheY-like chemotaxis protein
MTTAWCSIGYQLMLDAEPDLVRLRHRHERARGARRVERERPDLVVTDLTMAGRGGLDLIKDLIALHPELRVLVCSMHDETLYAERALRAGAKGYVMKDADGPTFLAAIRRVLEGQVYMSEKLAARVLDAFAGARPRGQPFTAGKTQRPRVRGVPSFRRRQDGEGNRRAAQPQPENGFGASRPHQGETRIHHERGDDPPGGALRGDGAIGRRER